MIDPSVLVVAVLGALVLGASALVTSISAVSQLIADLLVGLFASLRALAVISLLIACIVLVVLAGGPGAGPPVG